jgi:hypothetical protein
MPQAAASPGAIVALVCLTVLALLLWLALMAMLPDQTGGDPAGTAIARGFVQLWVVALWLVLGTMALLAVVMGEMPNTARLATIILVPVSCLVSLSAASLLTRPELPPYRWPLLGPAATPPLVLLFCYWALIPALRAWIPANAATAIVWGSVLVLDLALLPMTQLRQSVLDTQAAEAQRIRDAFDSVPAGAPMWEWAAFIGKDYPWPIDDKAVEAVRSLDRRQSDAETMLERGDFPLRYIGQFDLEPTPSLCEKARALLRRRAAAPLVPAPPSEPYGSVAQQISDAEQAMEWLVGLGCACDAESTAWEAVARSFDYDVERLVRLRDPAALGATLRNNPPRFSMVNSATHLRGWLSFADRPEYRAQALAGARALPHRTADAEEMLRDEWSGLTVLTNLTELDLTATPALCTPALARVRDRLSLAYRPPPDDPRTYADLIEQIRPWALPALIWLAEHGCDAKPALQDAIELVQLRQISPERDAMLAQLTALRDR